MKVYGLSCYSGVTDGWVDMDSQIVTDIRKF
jgi:hypothetical protein